MEDISKIFHIEWKILIAQIINFSLVVFLLWRYAFGPISKVLEDRSKKIEKGLQMAEEAKKSLAEAEEKAREVIREAKNESQKIMKDSFEQSEKLRQTELEKAKAESISIIESGKKSLLLEKENILKDIREKAVDIVVSASKATLKGVADEKTDEALIKTAKNNI